MSRLVTIIVVLLSSYNMAMAMTGRTDLCRDLKSWNSRDRGARELYSLINCDSMLSSCGTVNQQSRCNFPWVVSVRKKSTREHICVGTLVDENHIITAASCFKNGKSDAWQMEVGLGSDHTGYFDYVEIRSIVSHPKFKFKRFENDIAVVTLREKLRFTSCIQPICLPGRANFPSPGDDVTVAGWGHSSSYPPEKRLKPKILESRDINVVNIRDCRFTFPGVKSWEYRTCAGSWSNNNYICDGYTGAPLMIWHEGKWFLQAVSSRIHDCNNLNIFTNIPNFASWIETALKRG